LLIVGALCALVPAAGQLSDRLARNPAALSLGDQLSAAAAPADSGDLTLCVDGPEFMAAVRSDLQGAREEVLVQTLAFEADAAGLALAVALLDCPAPRRMLLIDDYSRLVQSDKLIGAPNRLFDAALTREAEQTRTLITQLRAHGVDVRYGRPLRTGADALQPRDHKKLIVIDDRIAYVGGINFSAHNFLWHDLMLRLDRPEPAVFLAADFRRSWRGETQPTQSHFQDLDLVCAAGGGNGAVQQTITNVIDDAEESIVLQCPYVTEPYLELLGAARRRGVDVTILTSERSNRFCMKQSIMDACRKHDLELRLLPGPMTHVKALLVDNATLLVGSANFDFLSATQQPEIVAVVRDTELVAAFQRRVLAPDLVSSRQWLPTETDATVTGFGAGVMRLARELVQVVAEIQPGR
jgi:cardiolipin synthase